MRAVGAGRALSFLFLAVGSGGELGRPPVPEEGVEEAVGQGERQLSKCKWDFVKGVTKCTKNNGEVCWSEPKEGVEKVPEKKKKLSSKERRAIKEAARKAGGS